MKHFTYTNDATVPSWEEGRVGDLKSMLFHLIRESICFSEDVSVRLCERDQSVLQLPLEKGCMLEMLANGISPVFLT